MESSPPGIFFFFILYFPVPLRLSCQLPPLLSLPQAVFFTSSSFKQDSPGVNI